jgi:hypothetical protein
MVPERFHQGLGFHLGFRCGVERWKFHHAEDRAVLRRRYADRARGWVVLRERQARRRGIGDPHDGGGKAVRSRRERQSAVEQHDRFVVGVKPGDDAADVGCHGGGARERQRDGRQEGQL